MNGKEIAFRIATRADLPSIVRLLADDDLGSQREQYEDPLPESYDEMGDRARARKRRAYCSIDHTSVSRRRASVLREIGIQENTCGYEIKSQIKLALLLFVFLFIFLGPSLTSPAHVLNLRCPK